MVVKKIDLNGEWQLAWQKKQDTANFDKRPLNSLIAVDVPGDVHSALLKAGTIKDPVNAGNENKTAWVGQQEWWFYRDFKLPEHDGIVEIKFGGLDLDAEIWLNNHLIASHQNAFCHLTVDVTEFVQKENSLAVRLLPHLANLDELPDGKMLHQTFCDDPVSMSPETARRRPWMRKAQYTFGWDWTRDLNTCGVWRDVTISLIKDCKLENAWIRALSINDNKAELECLCESTYFGADAASADLHIDLYLKSTGDRKASFSQKVNITPGTSLHSVNMCIEDPALWWPLNHGSQNMYTAHFQLVKASHPLAEETIEFGIRSVEIEEGARKKEGASRFRFLINGRAVFMKGANWVPADIIPGRVSSEHRKHLLELARDAGINYLRVWGGGIYEDSEFYALCDEFGIMVWQDFMFSCAEYPDFDRDFMDNVRIEIPTVIKELRNYPSIIAWCGNNEIDQQCNNDAFKNMRPHGQYYGQCIFYEIIPAFLDELDPSRPYLPSSACLGKNAGNGEDYLNVDNGIFHGPLGEIGEPDFMGNIPSFINEMHLCGSPPSRRSLDCFMPENLREWQNPIWGLHDFIPHDNPFCDSMLHKSIVSDFSMTFDEQSYYYKVLRSEMIKDKFEALRTSCWENSGVCLWMYNDAYPGATWSLVDYYGRRKMAYYFFKRACSPILVAACYTGPNINIHLLNETAQKRQGEILAEIMTFDGNILYSRKAGITLSEYQGRPVFTISGDMLCNVDKSASFAVLTYLENNEPVSRNRFFLTSIKKLEMPDAEPEIQRNTADGKLTSITVFSTKYIRNFSLEAKSASLSLQDNFFDIYPGQSREIKLTPPVPVDDLIIDWENRSSGLPQMLKLPFDEKDIIAGTTCVFNVKIFNPTKNPKQYCLQVAASDYVKYEYNENSTYPVKPGNSELIPVKIFVPVAAAGKKRVAAEVTLISDAAEHTVPLSLNILYPLVLAISNGILTVSSMSENSIHDLEVDIYWESFDAPDICCDQICIPELGQGICIEHKLPFAGDVLPYSLKVCVKAGQLPLFKLSKWLDDFDYSVPATRREFSESRANIFYQDNCRPALKNSNVLFLNKNSDNRHISISGNANAEILLAMNCNATTLFIDIIIENDTCDVIGEGDPLHHGSCVEFGLSCDDNLSLEAVAGLTNKGPVLQVRRLFNQTPPPEAADIDFFIVRKHPPEQETGITYYSFAIPWDKISKGYQPEKNDNIRTSFCFKTGKNSNFSLFAGIQGLKDISRYGVFKVK